MQHTVCIQKPQAQCLRDKDDIVGHVVVKRHRVAVQLPALKAVGDALQDQIDAFQRAGAMLGHGARDGGDRDVETALDHMARPQQQRRAAGKKHDDPCNAHNDNEATKRRKILNPEHLSRLNMPAPDFGRRPDQPCQVTRHQRLMETL